jgi:hypothetical protein
MKENLRLGSAIQNVIVPAAALSVGKWLNCPFVKAMRGKKSSNFVPPGAPDVRLKIGYLRLDVPKAAKQGDRTLEDQQFGSLCVQRQHVILLSS